MIDNPQGAGGYAYLSFRRRLRLQRGTLTHLYASAAAMSAHEDTNPANAPAVDWGLVGNVNVSPVLIALEASETAYYSRDIYAVAVANILDDVMQGFLDTFHPAKWWNVADVEPKIAGHSIARILDSLGNNFRHYPSWAKTPLPDREQLRSMIPLADVVGTTMHEGRYPALDGIMAWHVLDSIAAGGGYKAIEYSLRVAALNIVRNVGLSDSPFTSLLVVRVLMAQGR